MSGAGDGAGRAHARRTHASRARAERGSAIVEFVGVAALVLVPSVYLVLTLAELQAGLFAVESGAREAGRILAGAGGEDAGWAAAHARAEAAVGLAADDQGVPGGARLEVRCDADPCLTPGAGLVVVATAEVPLPLVPDAVAARLGADVTVRAEHLVRVDTFTEVRR